MKNNYADVIYNFTVYLLIHAEEFMESTNAVEVIQQEMLVQPW